MALLRILAVFIAGVFHLANVNDIIGTVYYHVDLCLRSGLAATPRIVGGEDGVQSQGLYDVPDMIHAQAFKRQSIPVVLDWCVEGVPPISAVGDGFRGTAERLGRVLSMLPHNCDRHVHTSMFKIDNQQGPTG